MGHVLGISAYYHDSAAAIVCDGRIVAAAQEERFSRKRHDPRFPRHAINYCLGEAFIDPSELDAVVFYDNPMLTLDRVVKNAAAVAPAGREHFVAACRGMLGAKARLREDLEATLGEAPRLMLTPHHLSHAASCFYPSPFAEAAILTIDGVGEWATCSIGHGSGASIELLRETRYPHSLGLLYSAFTAYCGFKVNSGEYKLMGLAPYGEPKYAKLIRDRLIDVKEDGSFRLDTSYFGFLDSGAMTNERFDALFGGPARARESEITRREMDLAASVQLVTEEIVLKLAAQARKLTGSRYLAMAGGVALNCVANGRVHRESGFDGLFVQPAAGDAGGALGAALLVSHRTFRAPRVIDRDDSLSGSLLGPRFAPRDVAAILDRQDWPSQSEPDPDERARVVARALADGKVVGWFSGRMEFGPRALGARSILGDPRRPDMQSAMNLKVKFRESFRPFAPAVLAERAADYFEIEGESPYMLLVAPVKSERCLPAEPLAEDSDDMLPVINRARSDIPAVTHVDYSARVQTVDAERNPDFARVLLAFEALTGCAVLVNTSFNVRGEPIVCTPQDAYRCFMRTDIDLLVIEDRLLWKHQQPAWSENEDWRLAHELD
ncbi:carbamoyltransferase [uncultured Rhodoblastus sp.]|uniref:carbamoyltransferase family protein n=1 Tax=uncultured Rhodoblastus sp. TaxID=543037 RepID=UPI0025D5E744|nr:carbamoyltransferase [uncultured Rhodoblastus sp.]